MLDMWKALGIILNTEGNTSTCTQEEKVLKVMAKEGKENGERREGERPGVLIVRL